MAVPSAGVSQVFAKELAILKDAPGTDLMARLFRKLATLPGDKRLRDELGHGKANQGVTVFLEASVLHGQAMNVQFAGQFHRVTQDGVAISTPVRLSDAAVAVGIPLELGERRVQASLAVPWAYYHKHETHTSMPTLIFGATNLGDLAYPRKLGKELTVLDFHVRLQCKDRQAPNPDLSVTARMKYQASLGEDWTNNQAGVAEPPAQELLLQGGMGPHHPGNTHLEFMVTSKGAAHPHSWESAFGEDNLVLHKAKLVLQMSDQRMQDKAHSGAESATIKGEAVLAMQQGQETKKLHLPALGYMNMAKPQLSRLVCGTGSFKFPVVSKLPQEYQRIQVAFQLNSKDMKAFNEQAVRTHKVFNRPSVAKTSRALKELGVSLGNTFEVQSISGGKVKLEGTSTPFQVKYVARYFGHLSTTALDFSLEDMNRVRKGAYHISPDEAYQCSKEDVVEVGYGYTTLAKAKVRCDALPACKSFLLHKGEAWFCAKPATRGQPTGGYTAATLTSSDAVLMSSKEMAAFNQLGMARAFPKVLAQGFSEHAALFGFKFMPTVTVKGGEQWLVLNVRPTKEEVSRDKLQEALLQAVKHILMAPRHDDGGLYTVDHVPMAEGISSAIQAKLSQLRALPSDIEQTLAEQTQEAISAAEVAMGLTSHPPKPHTLMGQVAAKTAAAETKAVRRISEKPVDKLTHDEATKKIAGFKAHSANLLRDAKRQMHSILAELEPAVTAGASAVKRVANALAKKMPRVRSINVSDLYVQCVFDQQCDPHKIRSPTIQVCFTETGCSGAQPFPGNAGLGDWLTRQAKVSIVAFLQQHLQFKQVKVHVPDTLVTKVGGLIQVGTHEPAAVNAPVSIEKIGRVFSVPTDVKNATALQAWSEQPRQSVPAHEIAQHTIPESLTTGGALNKMLKSVHDTGLKDALEMGLDKKGTLPLDPDEDEALLQTRKPDQSILHPDVLKIEEETRKPVKVKREVFTTMQAIGIAEREWTATVSKAFKPLVQPEFNKKSNVAHSIVKLKAFCMGARRQISRIQGSMKSFEDVYEDTDKGPLMSFMLKFGKVTGKDLITEYAQIIGDLELKARGISKYLITSINDAILLGKNPVVEKDGLTQLDAATLGLVSQPKYLKDLSLSKTEFYKLETTIKEGDTGKAANMWGKHKMADLFQDFYDKLEAEWNRKQEEHSHRVTKAAYHAIHQSYVDGVAAEKGNQEVMQPFPEAGMNATVNATVEANFTMPSVATLKKQAMAHAREHMANIAKRGFSAQQMIKQVQAMYAGTTIQFTTDPHHYASSHQSPSITIVGTAGQIEAKVNALPLRGQSFKRTYMAKNGLGIGHIRHVVIRADPQVGNPWLCTSFRVQVGRGNDWVALLPQGRIRSSWWLDGAKGREPPYYHLPKKGAWLLAPSGMTAARNRKKFRSVDVGSIHVSRHAKKGEKLKRPMCGHRAYGDFKFGKLDGECKTFSLCQGYDNHWDAKTRKWRRPVSSCHHSQINSLEDCAKTAEMSGQCALDYVQWSSGKNYKRPDMVPVGETNKLSAAPKGRYCFCNPKGKSLDSRKAVDTSNPLAHVLYPLVKGYIKSAKVKGFNFERTWQFHKILVDKSPACKDIRCLKGTYDKLRQTCGGDDRCDGFTFASGGDKDKKWLKKVHYGCLKKRCFGYSNNETDAIKYVTKGTDYYERAGYTLDDERKEKAHAVKAKEKHQKSAIVKEKQVKVSTAKKAKESRRLHELSASREVKEKWTRPFWDVPNGYGKCTTTSLKEPKDPCSLYRKEHCIVPGAKGAFKRIGFAVNCKWGGSLVIKGCNYRCQRVGDPPKGWTGPAAVGMKDENYQANLFKHDEELEAVALPESNQQLEETPWGRFPPLH
jgi:hypothetical protein